MWIESLAWKNKNEGANLPFWLATKPNSRLFIHTGASPFGQKIASFGFGQFWWTKINNSQGGLRKKLSWRVHDVMVSQRVSPIPWPMMWILRQTYLVPQFTWHKSSSSRLSAHGLSGPGDRSIDRNKINTFFHQTNKKLFNHTFLKIALKISKIITSEDHQ